MWMMNAFGATESAFTRGGETLIRNTGEPMASILPLARQKRAQQLFKAFDAGGLLRTHSCAWWIFAHPPLYAVPTLLDGCNMCCSSCVRAIYAVPGACVIQLWDPQNIRHCWLVPLSEYVSDGTCRSEHIHRYARIHNLVLKV